MARYSNYRQSLHKNSFAAAIIHRSKALTKGSFIKNLVLGGLALGLLGALVIFLGYLYFMATLPSADDILIRDVAQSTKIYDRTGTRLLYEIAKNEKRTVVPFEQIPKNLINATITAEDRSFYTHGGISYLSILRSAYENIKCGCKAQGASTLTQQMVRNVILTSDKTYTRKIKEVLLSYAVEGKFTKDQILGIYLNQIGYGSMNYGVESASQAYFGKTVADLSLAQSATLAAMPKQPSTYLRDPDRLKIRRDWILLNMKELGYATHDEVIIALAEETLVVSKLNNITAPHFVLWVKEQLEKEYTVREVETGGLKVITTIDYDKQMLAEAAVKDGVEKRKDLYGFNNAGLLSIDPKTGQILAMVGSVDYNDDEIQGQVNITQAELQPGSIIKPIVYAAAWEKGYTPNTILWDVDTVFSTTTGTYEPRNFDGSEHGFVTMRKALQGSLNIPAVKTLDLITVPTAIDFAEKMGYTTMKDRSIYGISFVLGGVKITMIDHLRAFGTFANGGLQMETVGILKVDDANGKTIKEWKPEEHLGKQVIDANLANMVSNVLSDNAARAFIFGMNSALQLGNRPVAAKSGTTNTGTADGMANRPKDTWTAGYTPSLATVVWAGNTNGSALNNNAESVFVAAPIWKDYMQKALEGTPIEQFPTPTIDQTGKPMLDGNIPTSTYTIDVISGKIATEFTPERNRKPISCGEYHTILTYINPADPRGAVPMDPTVNPKYQVWENSVQAWLTKRNANLKPGEVPIITCQNIPTETDSVHTIDSIPTIQITSPSNNQSVGRSITVTLNAGVKGIFSRVEYSIDGALVNTSTDMNGTTFTMPTWVTVGGHTLTASIFDSNDNSADIDVIINVTESSGIEANFRITNPFSNQSIENPGAPYTVVIEVSNPSTITYLEVTAQNLWTGVVTVISSTETPSSITSFSWDLGSDAKYQLIARASSTTGQTLESKPIIVMVITPILATGIPVLSQ